MTSQELRAETIKELATKALEETNKMWDNKESHAIIVGYLMGTLKAIRDNVVVEEVINQ